MPRLSLPPASFDVQGMAKFAGVMMDSLLGMQQNQQQMMMIMTGGGSSSSGRGRPLQSLEALAGNVSQENCQLRLSSASAKFEGRALHDFQGRARHSPLLSLSDGHASLHEAVPSQEMPWPQWSLLLWHRCLLHQRLRLQQTHHRLQRNRLWLQLHRRLWPPQQLWSCWMFCKQEMLTKS